MHWVQPKAFLIAHSSCSYDAMHRWLSSLGAGEYAQARSAVEDQWPFRPEDIVQAAGQRCYMSFVPGLNPNVVKVRTDQYDYIQNILKQGHGSVLEHATFSIAIENVSRVFTGELNRHRAGMAISEGSMRYIRYNNLPLVLTPFLNSAEGDGMKVLMEEGAHHIERAYNFMVAEHVKDDMPFEKKKQLTSLIRRILPMGIATGGIWTGNARAWRHILALRGSAAAEEEIRDVMLLILPLLQGVAPSLFADFDYDSKGGIICKYPKV